MLICPTCRSTFSGGEQFCPKDGTPLRTALPEDPLAGRVLSGRYRLMEVLGRGGMGAVYRAHHILMDKPVAVKVLRSELASDPEAVARFHREARSASRLDHEHVIRVTDFGQTDDGLLFLVMELLDGSNLAVLLRGGPLPWRRAAIIARDIALGLAHAHELGVVHRDLKPENVVLVKRGKSRQLIKVLDFGLAKLVKGPGALDSENPEDRDDPQAKSLTQTGVVFGTPEYMSPEQAEGRPLDARADLYALGVVLFQMVSGKLPFTASSFVALIAKTVTDPAPLPTTLSPQIEIPDELEALIMRCLEKSPDRRPQSADEVAEALDELLARHPPDELSRSAEASWPLSAGTGAASNRLGSGTPGSGSPGGPSPGAGVALPGGVAKTVQRQLAPGQAPRIAPAEPEPVSEPGPGPGSPPAVDGSSEPPPKTDPRPAPPVQAAALSDSGAGALASAYQAAVDQGAVRPSQSAELPGLERSGPSVFSPTLPALASSAASPASSGELPPADLAQKDPAPAPVPAPAPTGTGKHGASRSGRRPAVLADTVPARDDGEPLRVPRRPYWIGALALGGLLVAGGVYYGPRLVRKPHVVESPVSEPLRKARALLANPTALTSTQIDEVVRLLLGERAEHNSPELQRLLSSAYELENNRLRALGHMYAAVKLSESTSEEAGCQLALAQLLSRLGHTPEACQAAYRVLANRPGLKPDVKRPTQALIDTLRCR